MYNIKTINILYYIYMMIIYNIKYLFYSLFKNFQTKKINQEYKNIDIRNDIIFIYGFIGYDNNNFFDINYWKILKFKDNNKKKFIIPEISPTLSNHDRACELFNCIIGNKVNYNGNNNNKNNIHNHYYTNNIIYKPIYKNWCKDDKKLDFICHSMGGNTLIEMIKLCENGYFGSEYINCTNYIDKVMFISSPIKSGNFHLKNNIFINFVMKFIGLIIYIYNLIVPIFIQRKIFYVNYPKNMSYKNVITDIAIKDLFKDDTIHKYNILQKLNILNIITYNNIYINLYNKKINVISYNNKISQILFSFITFIKYNLNYLNDSIITLDSQEIHKNKFDIKLNNYKCIYYYAQHNNIIDLMNLILHENIYTEKNNVYNLIKDINRFFTH